MVLVFAIFDRCSVPFKGSVTPFHQIAQVEMEQQ